MSRHRLTFVEVLSLAIRRIISRDLLESRPREVFLTCSRATRASRNRPVVVVIIKLRGQAIGLVDLRC